MFVGMYILLFLYLSAAVMTNGIQLSRNYSDFCATFFVYTPYVTSGMSVAFSPYTIWNVMFTTAFATANSTSMEIFDALMLSGEDEDALIKGYKSLNDRLAKTYSSNGDKDVSLESRIYMFLDDELEINPEFKAIATYGVGVQTKAMSFSNSTAAQITANNFALKTLGFVRGSLLFKEDFDQSKMVINSLLTFKGQWRLPFSISDTTIEPFYDERGDEIREVYMMHQRNRFRFANIREINAFVLELPYVSNNKYCMLILLPLLGEGVTDLYMKLVYFNFIDILERLDEETRNHGLEYVDVKIPRFVMRRRINIDAVLRYCYVFEIFDSKSANFSRATGEPLSVSSLDHYVGITVNESGTIASSYTTAVFTDLEQKLDNRPGANFVVPAKMNSISPPGFLVNRPFMYYVVEKTTAAVIFGGVYAHGFIP